MKKVLLVVDMQEDFLRGALGNAVCEAVIPAIRDLINESDYDVYIATQDTHDEGYLETAEGKHLPVPHCIEGTDGWKIEQSIYDALENVNRQVLYVTKPSFGSADVADIISDIERSGEQVQVDIVGVCTDICVLSNAVMLKSMTNAEVRVFAKYCAGVSVASHKAALKALEAIFVEVTDDLVPCYYYVDDGKIVISGMEYVDFMDMYADGANGEDGVIDEENKGEPYNYFCEINEAMWDIDCPEDSEAVFDMNGHSIEYIIAGMRKAGFLLIKDDEIEVEV